MAISTVAETTVYDASGAGGAANGNIIQLVVASEGAANNLVVSPLTSASVQPYAPPTGTSNVPLNAKPVPVANLQITAGGTSYLASWSNPA